jgi:hypothetical protein
VEEERGREGKLRKRDRGGDKDRGRDREKKVGQIF